jgi:hypothetical protein
VFAEHSNFKDDSWGMYYKTLQIRNLREMDRFSSKLLTSKKLVNVVDS